MRIDNAGMRNLRLVRVIMQISRHYFFTMSELATSEHESQGSNDLKKYAHLTTAKKSTEYFERTSVFIMCVITDCY